MFFLALFLIGRIESGKIEKQAKEDIVSIYKSKGIKLDTNTIPKDSEISYYSLFRDIDSEKLIAKSVLGAEDMVAAGGNVYRYDNLLGNAVFHSGGYFEIALSGKIFDDMSEASLSSFLGGLGIDTDTSSAMTENNGDKKTVTFACVYNKTRILNCNVTMVFEGSSLKELKGRRLTSEPSPEDEVIMDVKTALINFLNGISTLGVLCTEVNSVSAGFYLTEPTAGNAELLPVWYVSTNVGKYYVNGINGRISAFND